MKITYPEFKRSRFFFLKYFAGQMVMVLALFATLQVTRPIGAWHFALSWLHLVLLPIAFCVGVQVPVALHNAVHFNIKPRWLNELVGELCGFFVLFGMGPFRISHALHHRHPDTDLDPHPPVGKSFWYFLSTTQLNTIRVIARHYFELHGKSRQTYATMVVQMLCYYVGLVLRPWCWLLVLGPTVFVTFFVPAYLANLIVFAHINWATHQTLADGSVVIVNLNHNWYYKVLNVIASGAYFHLNHHHRPNLYNPQLLETRAATHLSAPMVQVVGQ